VTGEAALIISILAVIVIPLLVAVLRSAIRWKGIEDRLDSVVSNLSSIVKNEDKIHGEFIAQMREDRKATDRRLRYLEENLWSRNRGNSST
jgi:hypothetical protein